VWVKTRTKEKFMRFDLDSIFGIHEQGVLIRSKRAEILAGNLVNADTPNFKARDIDFKQVLQEAQAGSDMQRMKVTNPKHMQTSGPEGFATDLLYRNSLQPSVDGNTVDSQVEKAQFIENAMQYQASLSFLSGKIKSLISAIRGE
jgi:flagellar basal-body rod protein FlgB